MSKWLIVFLLFAQWAKSDELVCQQYGHTSNPEEFHSIPVKVKETRFFFDQQGVTVGSRHYEPMDPAEVGLEGLALTYFQPKEEQVLYLYRKDDGVEVGVSYIERDSDTIFADKVLYTNCHFDDSKGGISHAVTSKAPDPKTGGGQASQPSFRF